MYTEAYVKQLEEKIEALEKENKSLHETVEYLTRKLFGRSTEKTSVLLGQYSFFDEAVYSIIETAKVNGLNSYEYLKFIFKISQEFSLVNILNF